MVILHLQLSFHVQIMTFDLIAVNIFVIFIIKIASLTIVKICQNTTNDTLIISLQSITASTIIVNSTIIIVIIIIDSAETIFDRRNLWITSAEKHTNLRTNMNIKITIIISNIIINLI